MPFRSIDDRFYAWGAPVPDVSAPRVAAKARRAASPFPKRVRVSVLFAMAGRTLEVAGGANVTVHWLT
ncbi:MAG: hypothetical protein KF822_10470 [Steroidobacteraceae bacterium]|nr:hypothetical protein [Steroidobacteraceae bacterium]